MDFFNKVISHFKNALSDVHNFDGILLNSSPGDSTNDLDNLDLLGLHFMTQSTEGSSTVDRITDNDENQIEIIDLTDDADDLDVILVEESQPKPTDDRQAYQLNENKAEPWPIIDLDEYCDFVKNMDGQKIEVSNYLKSQDAEVSYYSNSHIAERFDTSQNCEPRVSNSANSKVTKVTVKANSKKVKVYSNKMQEEKVSDYPKSKEPEVTDTANSKEAVYDNSESHRAEVFENLINDEGEKVDDKPISLEVEDPSYLKSQEVVFSESSKCQEAVVSDNPNNKEVSNNPINQKTEESAKAKTDELYCNPGTNKALAVDSCTSTENYHSDGTQNCSSQVSFPDYEDQINRFTIIVSEDYSSSTPNVQCPKKLVKNYNNIYIKVSGAGKLVKDSMQVGANDSMQVKAKDSMQVGAKDSMQVGANDSMQVKAKDSMQVGAKDSMQVGANDSMQVGAKDSMQVGAKDNMQVGAKDSMQVGANDSMQVGAKDSMQVGAKDSMQVGAKDNMQVGAKDSMQVGANDSMQVGAKDSMQVGANDSMQVGAKDSMQFGAKDSMQVEAKDSMQIGANDSMQVGAKDSMQVGAKDSIKVEAKDSMQVRVEDSMQVRVEGSMQVGVKDSMQVGVTETCPSKPPVLKSESENKEEVSCSSEQVVKESDFNFEDNEELIYVVTMKGNISDTKDMIPSNKERKINSSDSDPSNFKNVKDGDTKDSHTENNSERNEILIVKNLNENNSKEIKVSPDSEVKCSTDANDFYDSDEYCEGYHSSDFEFITESDAEADGLYLMSERTSRKKKNSAKTLTEDTADESALNTNTIKKSNYTVTSAVEPKPSTSTDHDCKPPANNYIDKSALNTNTTEKFNNTIAFLEESKPSTSADHNFKPPANNYKDYRGMRRRFQEEEAERLRQNHIQPQGQNFLDLFYGPNAAVAQDLFILENKSIRPPSVMNAQYEGLGFDMNLVDQQQNLNVEDRRESQQSAKQILDMYQTENRPRRVTRRRRRNW